MGRQAAKKRRAELRDGLQQQAAATSKTAGLCSAAFKTHGPDADWVDCGYCKTFHVACCGFASADDADASRHHPNGDRKWVICSLCGVPHAKRCDWDGAGEDSDLYDLGDVAGCAVCAGPLEDDAWDCDACGESVCNGCMAYLNVQDHIAICGDCVGTCGVCDRNWSEEVDGGDDTESWVATHDVVGGGEDGEQLTCPECYRELY